MDIESPHLRYAWKALAFRRLRTTVGAWRQIKPESLYGLARGAKAAARLLTEMGVTRPSEITPALGQELVRRVKDKQWGTIYAQAVLNSVVQLHAFREHLVDAPLRHPLKGKSARISLGLPGNPRLENSTPRIPEAVMGPVLQWAIRYVNDFADEILGVAARVSHKEYRIACKGQRTPFGDTARRLLPYLDALRRDGRGLPTKAEGDHGRTTVAWPGDADKKVAARIDWTTISQEIGVGVLNRADPASAVVKMIDQFLSDVGLESSRSLRDDEVETLAALRGSAWTQRCAKYERGMLAVASYIVIAYLTGMRDSEVKGLVRGCLRQSMSADGLRTRWFIRGYVYKGRKTPEQGDWVAIEPVVRAIRVLERITDKRNTSAKQPLTRVAQINGARLKGWCAHVNTLASRGRTVPQIPAWPINSRQLRRTFAWYIANRPGGVIAGMIQYKQASIMIFEGYHGLSKSGFAAEVEQERAVAQEVAAMDVFEQWQSGAQLRGPGAAELEAAFQEVHTALAAEVNPTDRRVRELLKSKAVHLQVGLLADCKFREASARCLQVASKPRDGAPGPILNVCNKQNCKHAVVTERHRPVWEACIADTKALLADPVLSVPQRAVLEGELRRQLTVLGDIDTATEMPGGEAP